MGDVGLRYCIDLGVEGVQLGHTVVRTEAFVHGDIDIGQEVYIVVISQLLCFVFSFISLENHVQIVNVSIFVVLLFGKEGDENRVVSSKRFCLIQQVLREELVPELFVGFPLSAVFKRCRINFYKLLISGV